MSYMRIGYPMRCVDGTTDDYIFGSQKDGKEYIEDYGGISNESIIEILFHRWKTDDDLIKGYLLKQLAERLKVKLRPRPLTDEEEEILFEEMMQEEREEDEWLEQKQRAEMEEENE